jgi:rhodanese-related sulfurtransferase
MKELEKTKHISIAAVLTILAVVIALLSYKRPKYLYAEDPNNTLEKITTNDYFIAIDEIDKANSVLVDVRNGFDYNRGHIENAINIATAEILEDDNSDILKKVKDDNKIIVLYGNNTNETVLPFLLLSQLGYDNLKVLSVNLSYEQNKLIAQNAVTEASAPDINAFIQESAKKSAEAMNEDYETSESNTPSTPKKVITIRKKKKTQAEGGC